MKYIILAMVLLVSCVGCANQRAITAGWQPSPLPTVSAQSEQIPADMLHDFDAAADEAKYNHGPRATYSSSYSPFVYATYPYRVYGYRHHYLHPYRYWRHYCSGGRYCH